MSVQDFFSTLLGAVTTINLIWLAVSRVDLAWSGLLAVALVLGLPHIVTRHRFAARDDPSYWRVLRPLLLEDLSHYPNFQQPPGVCHLAHLQALRAPEGAILLHPEALPGLVTFPSFHTGAGIVLCGAFWRSRAFAPVAAYAAVMIAATPVHGGHYIVDLLAGVALVGAVLAILARRPAYRGLFARHGGQPGGVAQQA